MLRPDPEKRMGLLLRKSGFWAFRHCGPALPPPQSWRDRVPEVCGEFPAYSSLSCPMAIVTANF